MGMAGPPPGGPHMAMGPGAMPPMMMGHGARGPAAIGGRWFDRADADHDGKLTAAEARSAALAMFDRFDSNHDGTISPDERRMAFRGVLRHRPDFGDLPPPPPVQG